MRTRRSLPRRREHSGAYHRCQRRRFASRSRTSPRAKPPAASISARSPPQLLAPNCGAGPRTRFAALLRPRRCRARRAAEPPAPTGTAALTAWPALPPASITSRSKCNALNCGVWSKRRIAAPNQCARPLQQIRRRRRERRPAITKWPALPAASMPALGRDRSSPGEASARRTRRAAGPTAAAGNARHCHEAAIVARGTDRSAVHRTESCVAPGRPLGRGRPSSQQSTAPPC